MADEIAILTGDGGREFQILMLFPIATPKQVNGQNVVPTPSSTIPPSGALVLTAAEKTELDAGRQGFRVVTFYKDPAMTNPQLVTRAQQIYAAQKTEFDRWYGETYRHIGARINA